MNVLPNIPKVFNGKFPSDYVNDVDGFGFSAEELAENKGKLLTLDIDITPGKVCSLKCPQCFSHNGAIDEKGGKPLSGEEMLSVILQGKELGLKSVKLLGRGEHTENLNLIPFVEKMSELELVTLIFTKGHVIGDDAAVDRIHGYSGIHTGKQLVEKLSSLNTRILLGCRTFDSVKEDKIVGMLGYSAKRNRAMELLANAGFTQHNPTYLGLITNPVVKNTIDDVFDVYAFGKERNMYVCAAPTMVSGRGRLKIPKTTPTREQLIDLYTGIYEWNILHGVQTLTKIREEGISSYAGSRPCSLPASGLYISYYGDVFMSEGNDSEGFNYGNIRDRPLKEIWESSRNFKEFSGKANCGCPAKDGITIPDDLYQTVLDNLTKKFS